MDKFASSRLSFIVRTWLEESAAQTRKAAWRGSITHVPSGAQRYFDRFDAIAEFIRKYQAEIEAQVLTDASASTGPEERD